MLGTASDGSSTDYDTRYRILAPVIESSHDFSRIARLVAGQFWHELDQEERARFIDAFRRASIATYVTRFTSANGLEFEPATLQESGERRVTVHSRLLRPEAVPISFVYVLQEENDRWRIVTIFVDGVSELAMQRAELTELYRRAGLSEVIAKLEEMAAQP